MKQNSETLTSMPATEETTVTATGGGVDTPTDQRIQCNTVLHSVTSTSGKHIICSEYKQGSWGHIVHTHVGEAYF